MKWRRSGSFINIIGIFLLVVFSTTCESKNIIKDAILGHISNFDFTKISQNCSIQLSEMIQTLEMDPDSWGLQMLDATSKLQAGILSYNFGELGNFEQCIKIEGTTKYGGPVKGKYCLGFLRLEALRKEEQKDVDQMTDFQRRSNSIANMGRLVNDSGPTWALCVPNQCKGEDATIFINFLISNYVSEGISIHFPEMLCQTKDEAYPELTTAASTTIATLGALTLIIAASTFYDFHRKKQKKGKYLEILTSFSLIKNGPKSVSIPKRSDQIPCLHGIKFWSMIWIVLNHQYSVTGAGPITNSKYLTEWANSLHSMFIVSGTLSVDTFFVAGGVLMVYGFLKVITRTKSINIPLYYLHRYIRLTPALGAVVLISSTLLVYLGSGPKWPLVKPYFQENCANYWWSTMLYVQNYINVSQMCVGQSWYLCIDMQLFLISPILFFILWKKSKIGLLLAFLAIASCMSFSFAAAWNHELTAILSNIYGNSTAYSNEYYLLSHTRATPWFIGVILGYFLFQIKEGNIKFTINKTWSFIYCFGSLLVLLGCIFAGHNNLRSADYDKWGNSLHILLVRPIWSLAISCLVLTCTCGHGGPVNWILSRSIYQVLNRFTYALYLIHVTVIYLLVFAKKIPDYFSDFNMFYEFWGTLWLSTVLSIILVLAVEMPLCNLEKSLLDLATNNKEQNKDSCYKSIKLKIFNHSDNNEQQHEEMV